MAVTYGTGRYSNLTYGTPPTTPAAESVLLLGAG